MGLSNELASLFVKVTKNDAPKKSETICYGTVVNYDNGTYVKLDGSELLTPVNSTTDAIDGERVTVMIKNHSATITGNISAPAARKKAVDEEILDVKTILADKITVTELNAAIANIDILYAKQATFDELNATVATIKDAYIDKATVENLYATKATIDILDADVAYIKKTYITEASISQLYAKKAEIEDLYATKATVGALDADLAVIKDAYISKASVDDLYARKAAVEDLSADVATIKSAYITEAEVKNLTADFATITELTAVDGKFAGLDSKYASIGDLDVATADIINLRTDLGEINTLIFGSATGNIIQTNFANAVIAQLGQAQIKSAMIESIAASKITSGDIITNNVRVMSEDGSLVISDETIQISDDNRVRVQIGKDASGDYSINIWDTDGQLMFSKGGITDKAIKTAIIRNDMVADNANISAGKLDIDSLFEEINNSTNTIKSTKIYVDDEGQTLDIAFLKMETDIDSISVGGRNLILGTSSDVEYVATSKSGPGITSKDVAFTASSRLGNLKTISGLEYVLSFDAKATSSIEVYCCVAAAGAVSNLKHMVSITGQTLNDQRCGVSVTAEWKRYWVKIIFSDIPPSHVSFGVGENKTSDTLYVRAIKLEEGNKPTSWTPAPEDLAEVVSSQGTAISVMQGQISSKIWKSDIDEATGTISDSVSTINQTLTGIEANVSNLTTRMGSVETKTADLALDLDGISASVIETRDDLAGLVIGARNLLRNTGGGDPIRMTNDATHAISGVSSVSNVDGVQTLNCSASGTKEIYYRFMLPSSVNLYGLEVGKSYVLSGKVKVTTTSGTLANLTARSQEYTYHWTGGTATVITSEDTSDWVYFSSKFTISNEATGAYASLQLYYTDSWVGTIQMKELKLEKGTRPTDWSLAPEDTELIYHANNAYAAKSDFLIEKDKIAGIVKEFDGPEGRVSKLEQTSGSLTFKIDNLSVGTRNLLANTSNEEKVLGGYPSSGYVEGVFGKTINIPTKDEYVLTFDAKSTVAGDKIRCHFHAPNTTTKVVSSEGWNGTAGDGVTEIPLTTEWKRYWVKYTQDGAATTSTKSWIVGRRMAGGGSGQVSVRGIKLEEGHVPTDWSPAPEDVKNDFINASKTATNYLKFDTNGLVVGDMTSATLLNNVQINSSGVNIRKGDTVLASFKEKEISLGRYTDDSEITLCDIGNIRVYQRGVTNQEAFLIESSGSMMLEAAGTMSIFGHGVNKNMIELGQSAESVNGQQVPIDDYYIKLQTINSNVSRISRMMLATGCQSYIETQEGLMIHAKNGLTLKSGIDADLVNLRITSSNFEVTDLAVSVLSGLDLIVSGDISVGGFKNKSDFRTKLSTWTYNKTDGDTRYPCLAGPDGSTAGYVRMPQTGVIPYQSGGNGTIGTTEWPFNNGYFKNLYISTASGSVKTYYGKGDSFNTTIHTAGYTTSSCTNIYFTIPLSKPVLGNPTVTIANVKGLILRQNNTYTHGSGWSNTNGGTYTYALPTYSTNTYVGGNGSYINVVCVLSNVANATNNSPIGIVADVSVTFS